MDRTLTINVRTLAGVAAVLLALAVAFLLGRGAPAAEASPTDPDGEPAAAPDARTLTMRGTGEVGVVPDQVGFRVSARLVRDDLTTALDDGNALMERVLTRLEELGVARGDTETTSLDMQPVYDYSDDQPPVLRGYRVSQSVAVLVRELDDAGGVIAAAVEEGGDAVRVDDISLRVGDPDAGLADARTAAVEDARAKAEAYAAASGAELGEVRTVVEISPERVDSVVAESALRSYAFDSAAASLASVPIRTGRSELAVTVQVVWSLA